LQKEEEEEAEDGPLQRVFLPNIENLPEDFRKVNLKVPIGFFWLYYAHPSLNGFSLAAFFFIRFEANLSEYGSYSLHIRMFWYIRKHHSFT
jgi:hypothetical protein